jgi:hypothetical protein
MDSARFGGYTLSRLFHITTKGYFRLGLKTVRKKDQVTSLIGANIPFILRKLPSREHYLIGETYVEGVKHREASDIHNSG